MNQSPILCLFRHAPYAMPSGREGIEAVLAFAAFEQPLSLLFIGEGVWQLLADQQAETVGRKPLDKLLTALPLYDVDNIYVCLNSLQQRGLREADLCVTTSALSATEIQQLLANHGPVISF